MMVAVLVLDMEMAVEGEGVAVVVAAPAALVPPLRLVEGFGEAPGDLEELLGGEGLHCGVSICGVRRGVWRGVSHPPET